MDAREASLFAYPDTYCIIKLTLSFFSVVAGRSGCRDFHFFLHSDLLAERIETFVSTSDSTTICRYCLPRS